MALIKSCLASGGSVTFTGETLPAANPINDAVIGDLYIVTETSDSSTVTGGDVIVNLHAGNVYVKLIQATATTITLSGTGVSGLAHIAVE